ncbi:MAG TPA: tetratricopeptide repeat protein [Bacteroidia bacterium]|jgi:tetratricopeptide (TPR) repeat protein
MKSFFRRTVICIFFSAIILLMMYCGNSEKPEEQEVPAVANVYLNHHDSAKYVGMGQCRLCHQSIYDSFIETGMGKSFDEASKQKSSAKFSKHTVIYDKYSDFYYHPFWENDSMKILEFRLSGKDTVYKRVERVDYIIGSGQHTNSHIQGVNGYLNQMPLTYYTQKGKWDLPPGFEGGFNTRFSRKIGLECMSCHNSLPGFEKGSENKFTSVPEGVSCERCHGPGSIHVGQRSSGSKVDTAKYIDYSIVNPGKLSIDLQFDVCQRCHLQGNTVLKEGKSFFDFKPGMKLSDHMTVFLPRYKGADDQFIMASHADRLKQSPCFIKSLEKADNKSLRPYKNALTCVTCHDPHVSVKVTGKEVFNNACRNCHNTNEKGFCTEKKEVRNKVQDNCVSCHMPRSGSIDIPHVTVHDHFIRKPIRKKEMEQIKQFIGLFAVNEKQPSDLVKAKAYIQQYEKFEYNIIFLDSAQSLLNDKARGDRKENFALTVHLWFIKKDFAKVLSCLNDVGENYVREAFTVKSWDNADAWTLYRIGEAFYNKGDIEKAALYYRKAVDLAPYNPEFSNKWAASLIAQNKIPEALRILSGITKENPKYVPALNNSGYAYLIAGDAVKAENLYNAALKLDPDYEPLLLNITGLKIYQEKYPEATEILKRVLKKNPGNEQAKNVLMQLKSLK